MQLDLGASKVAENISFSIERRVRTCFAVLKYFRDCQRGTDYIKKYAPNYIYIPFYPWFYDILQAFCPVISFFLVFILK